MWNNNYLANLQKSKREENYIIKICADHSDFGKQWFVNWLNVDWLTSSGKTICIFSMGTSSTIYNR